MEEASKPTKKKPAPTKPKHKIKKHTTKPLKVLQSDIVMKVSFYNTLFDQREKNNLELGY